MNKNFKQNIYNIYGAKGKQWLIDLPNIIEIIALSWDLSLLKQIDNLSMNYVASGFRGDQEIILKISLDEDLIFRERTALEALRAFGAVKVLGYKPNALLLEKLEPAISLKTYLPERGGEALKIACEVTKKLHQARIPSNINLPSIEERFSLLDKEWPITQNYLILAREYRDYIFKKYTTRKVLHGDLHHENILQDGGAWKVIDPHGVIGFPINEVWAFVYDIDKDIPFIADYLDFLIEDVNKCYFMHTVLSSLWAIEDNMDPKHYLQLADKVGKTIK
jgi:streptomycin 6-kinase